MCNAGSLILCECPSILPRRVRAVGAAVLLRWALPPPPYTVRAFPPTPCLLRIPAYYSGYRNPSLIVIAACRSEREEIREAERERSRTSCRHHASSLSVSIRDDLVTWMQVIERKMRERTLHKLESRVARLSSDRSLLLIRAKDDAIRRLDRPKASPQLQIRYASRSSEEEAKIRSGGNEALLRLQPLTAPDLSRDAAWRHHSACES
ncbi:hypothetical protein BJY59DRAFT_702405 [Rhodotorula toruloides]